MFNGEEEMEPIGWIVLGSNSYHQVQVFGTPEGGHPFRSERAAEQARKRMDAVHPTLDFLVLPITPGGLAMSSFNAHLEEMA